jgi:phosphohistidine phosphatase
MTDRSLVLLRHAKAEQAPGLPDEDRPLTARGHADSAAAGSWLARRGYLPDLVLCSPARRTRQTWHGVAVALADAGGAAAPEVRYEHAIYAGSAEDLLALVHAVADEVTTVLLIGHNPIISELSALLDPQATTDSDGMRTAGIAVHGVRGPWQSCQPGEAPLTAAATTRG